MRSEILDFIKIFSESTDTFILFKYSSCYWFSQILHQRFQQSSIYYNPHEIHFATKIGDDLYDISGIIEEEEYEYYYDFEEYIQSVSEEDRQIIIENCILLRR